MKPDWKDAPSWARYLAMNDTGSWYWYERRPIKDWDELSWYSVGRSAHSHNYSVDWSESLEERPK